MFQGKTKSWEIYNSPQGEMTPGTTQKIFLKTYHNLKRRLQRQKAAERRQLTKLPNKVPKGKVTELEQRESVPTREKTKFGRKSIEDIESKSSSEEAMGLKTLMISEIPILKYCSFIYVTLH